MKHIQLLTTTFAAFYWDKVVFQDYITNLSFSSHVKLIAAVNML